jgi:RNA polymerase sigma-70 factor (ECF subfamily)
MNESRPALETRPSLLIRLRDHGDRDAWESFVRLYGRLLFADCRRRGLQESDAEDVTQEVFARVVRAIRSFEYRRKCGRFRDWLGTIVRNEVWRFLKKNDKGQSVNERETLDDLPAPDPGWNELFHQHVLAEALRECQQHFAPDTWMAFECVWIQNMPPSEVAAAMQLSLDNVYLAKSRVLKRLVETVKLLSEDVPVA